MSIIEDDPEFVEILKMAHKIGFDDPVLRRGMEQRRIWGFVVDSQKLITPEEHVFLTALVTEQPDPNFLEKHGLSTYGWTDLANACKNIIAVFDDWTSGNVKNSVPFAPLPHPYPYELTIFGLGDVKIFLELYQMIALEESKKITNH